MKQVHVIPVPDGMTPTEALAECLLLGQLAEGRRVEADGTGGSWAAVEVDDEDLSYYL